MDDNVGLVLSKIRALGLENDTFIVFVSDNGGPTRVTTSSNAPLNGYKAQVWEGGIRVPFLMQYTGHIPAGKIVDQPVIQLDIHPTALALAGVKVPADAKLDGVNLLPYLTGEKPGAPHEALFWRFGAQRAVRKGDWKLTDMGNGPRLFNLASDIGEKHDLAGTNSAKLQELEADYKVWNAKNIAARWIPRRNVGAALGKPGHIDRLDVDRSKWVQRVRDFGRMFKRQIDDQDSLAAWIPATWAASIKSQAALEVRRNGSVGGDEPLADVQVRDLGQLGTLHRVIFGEHIAIEHVVDSGNQPAHGSWQAKVYIGTHVDGALPIRHRRNRIDDPEPVAQPDLPDVWKTELEQVLSFRRGQLGWLDRWQAVIGLIGYPDADRVIL